jgi:hypothetical protein
VNFQCTLILAQETAKCWNSIVENWREIYAEWRCGDHRECFDCSKTCHLVEQSIHKDWQANLQLLCERIAHVRDDLTHACDGALLHLLINLGRAQLLQCPRIEMRDEWTKVDCAWLFEWTNNFDVLLQNRKSFSCNLIESLSPSLPMLDLRFLTFFSDDL